MKNKIWLPAMSGFIFYFLSCQKVITPVLQNTSPQIVIEGIISDTAGPYQVLINNSASFYNGNNYASISGAKVAVTDVTAGITDSLTEISDGVYTTHNIKGVRGNKYQLYVLLDGKIYTAKSTMPVTVPLDSVSFDYANTKQIRPIAHFQDPANVANNYKFSIRVNGIALKQFELFDDLLSDGKYIRKKLDADTGALKTNDIVTVSLIGVDHDSYTFLKQAYNIAYNNSDLAAPATPTSNIIGGCVGYFSAQTVSSKSAIVAH